MSLMKPLLLVAILLPTLATAQSANPFADSAAKREAARQRDANRGLIRRGQSLEKVNTIGAVKARPGTEVPFSNPSPPDWKILQQVMQEGKFRDDKRVRNADEEFDTGIDSYSAALSEAQSLYPDLTDPSSAFTQRCAQLQSYFLSQGHALARNQRRPLLLAHIAAIEMYGSARRDSRQRTNDADVAAANIRRAEEMQRLEQARLQREAAEKQMDELFSYVVWDPKFKTLRLSDGTLLNSTSSLNGKLQFNLELALPRVGTAPATLPFPSTFEFDPSANTFTAPGRPLTPLQRDIDSNTFRLRQ